MAFITWRAELEVGIPAIDRQHQREVELVNELHEAILAEQDEPARSAIVKALLDHTTFHFRFEEAIMRANDFPGLLAHQREHSAVTEKLTGIAHEGGTGGHLLLIYTLCRWLKGHIVGFDMKYAPHLKARLVA